MTTAHARLRQAEELPGEFTRHNWKRSGCRAATKRELNPRWQGSESRQVLRRELRAQHGSEPGKKIYREMMGLPEVGTK